MERLFKSGGRSILVKNKLSEGDALKTVKQIENNDFQVIEILKDHSRSKVSRIRLNELDLVLKIPREKNKRLWIRFLTLFRQGEAFKNLRSMHFLNAIGFNSNEGYLACEYRQYGMVVNSWILYHYLSAEECLDKSETFRNVVKVLTDLHQKNVLHGDAQIRNFLTSEGKIFLIDANPIKSKSTFAKAKEFAYLKRSQPEIESFFKGIKYYELAKSFDTFDRKLARIKRSIKGALLLRK